VTAGLGAWIITNYINGNNTAGGAPHHVVRLRRLSADGGGRNDRHARRPKTVLKSAIQKVWTQGGSPDFAMDRSIQQDGHLGLHRHCHALSVTYPLEGRRRSSAAADVYVSDFGTISIVPNRFQPETDIYLVDKSMAGVT